MKKNILPAILLALLLASACTQQQQQQQPVTKEVLPQFNNQLTAEEKAGGLMTPEIMWEIRKIRGLLLYLPMDQQYYLPLLILILRVKQDEPTFSRLM
jgi:hypothetical protein